MRAAILACLAASALAAPVAAQDLASFQAPSGNIHCLFLPGEVRCDVLEASLSFAAPPAWCDLDWGHAFGLTAGGAAEPICAGDTVADPGAPVLGYGSTISRDGIACRAETTGVTCRNAAGRGFTLARGGQQVF